jgi:hypothetical protein
MHQKHYERGWRGDDLDHSGIDCNAPLGSGCQCSCCMRLIPPVCLECEETGPCQSCLEVWDPQVEPMRWRAQWSKWWAWRVNEHGTE